MGLGGGMYIEVYSNPQYQQDRVCGIFYLIRILLPLIWLAMSVIASLLERDILLHRDEMSLRRIANGCLAEEREVDDGGGVA